MMEIAQPICLFGEIPENSPNLQVFGGIEHDLKVLPWASVWGASGLVLDRHGEPLIDTIWRPDFLQQCPKYKFSKQRFIPRIKFGTYFNTMIFWCRGYYHWICDVLPRVQRALPHLPPETKFIIPEKLPQAFMDALESVGVSRERTVEFHGRRPWRVQKLIHVPPVAMTGDHTLEGARKLRETVFQKLGIQPSNAPTRKIYISRKSGLERVLVNDTEVVEALRPLGFERVFSENLSFAEQVACFADAQVVVGPHGGGMTNTMWCSSKSKVLELFHPQSVRRCYWSIAQAIGLNHACGVCEASDTSQGTHAMFCDVEKLLAAIKHLI